MNLDEQIAKLQALKAKSKLYEDMKDYVTKVYVETDAAVEFGTEIIEFLDSRIEKILNNSGDSPAIPGKPMPKAPPEEKPPVPLMPNDPIRFALKYRDAQGKEVTLHSKDGPITATVVGVSSPNIVIETSTGHTVHVPPTDLEGLE